MTSGDKEMKQVMRIIGSLSNEFREKFEKLEQKVEQLEHTITTIEIFAATFVKCMERHKETQ